MLPLRTMVIAAVASIALVGCGKAEEKKVVKAPAEKGIFVSTNDCIAAGKIPEEACIKAVDTAVLLHEKKAAAYKTMQQCTKVEGADRCDQTVDGQYRARLQAFLITLTVPPAAEPLYPAIAKKTIGFRSPTQKVIDAKDDTLIVSASAMSLAHDNAKLP
ncbi:MAG: hypothetical protein CTY31_13515 [Hyphomicrobium sp.]|nr:MAG: hypothetical protein CTY39_10420 [Hyphomicrobium sp.]PPC98418.1 MAG: hypothetical protein CTY31_13515 [Hyphomicrobium sp.]